MTDQKSLMALAFTWSAWESAFTRPDGEPEAIPTSISECTIDGKPVGSVMRFGTGRYTAFFPDQRHHSHIETEARAKGLVEHAAGGSTAPLDPRQIVRALMDGPRAATEEEVRHLVEALENTRELLGVCQQMRQRSPAASWIRIDLLPPPKDTPVLISRAGFKPQMASIPAHVAGAKFPTLESIEEPRRFEPPTHYAYVKGLGEPS